MHQLPTINRVAAVAALVLSLVVAGAAYAEPGFFTSECSSCHAAQGATCNGCHHHKGTLGAAAGSASYTPGAPVSVNLSGGTESGWFRALLYDQNNIEVDRVDYATFPVTLTATAPATPGDYVWNAAWYGNNNGAGHLEVRRAVTIRVQQDPAGAPDDQPPARIGTWGRVRSLFRR